MTSPIKQHLIDPEICIRCYTCEMNCPVEAIVHDDSNVVVDASKCNACMNCIPVCPTGSIDSWRVVDAPYALSDQYGWGELPAQGETHDAPVELSDAADDPVGQLLAQAHQGAGGGMRAPVFASMPTVNLFTIASPATARVQGSYRLTADDSDEIRHVILDFGALHFPVLEGQSIGVIPPGLDANGRPHLPRLYSISSPRDGERPGFNNLSLTVKRTPGGMCSTYLCDLKIGDEVKVAGPFGSTFLMPNDPSARLLLICTGTGSAPFRAFTMRRTRTGAASGDMVLFFGARGPDSLPYFGPLAKVPEHILRKHLVFSRMAGAPREYVQDRMLVERGAIADLLGDGRTHIYICGLRDMERGVEDAFARICETAGLDWFATRATLRVEGRYHVETY